MTVKEWETEPNKLGREVNGYHVLIIRSKEFGNLNGYVGVKRSHPYYGMHYDGKPCNMRVHGGLTFSGKGFLPEMKKGLWYFGFDTAHYFDLMPRMSHFNIGGGTYRNIEYVTNEVNSLYEQLREIEKLYPAHRINHKREYRRLHKIKQEEKRLRNFMWNNVGKS